MPRTTTSHLEAKFAARDAACVKLAEGEACFRRIAESDVVGLFFRTLEGGNFEAKAVFLAMLGYP